MADVGEVKYKVTADDSGLDQQIDKTEKGLVSKFGGAAKAVGAAAGTAIAAGTGAVVSLVKQASDAYGNYEQLVGGVETLFGSSADKVMQGADQAFKTAGMSANQYMETTIQSAAAMINSLGGDQAKAAEMVDMSITDMADNVNKMGTDMEAVQNAYRGFSRGNFTMLDNLALGFAGTKEGMQELLDKAQEINGIEYDIDSYADIVEAIHVVQTEMGITGTTSKEAAETLQGSTASMQAAWENLVTGMADPDADIGALLDNFLESAKAFIDNLIPILSQALEGIGELVAELAPVIVEELPALLESVLPKLLESGAKVIESLARGIIAAIPGLMPTITEVIIELSKMLISLAPDIIQCGLEIIVQLALGIAEALPELIPAVVEAILLIVEVLTEPNNLSMLIDAAIQIIMALIDGIMKALPKLLEQAPVIIANLAQAIIQAIPQLLGAAVQIILTIIEGIVSVFGKLIEVGADIVKSIKDGFSKKIEDAKNWGKDMINNFVSGIKEKWESLKSTASDVAGSVAKIFHHTHPDEGPLANDHTWMPDMMESFAKGIDEGAPKLKKSAINATQPILDAFNMDIGYNLPDIAGYAADLSASMTANNSMEIIVPLTIDGREIARASAWFMNEQLAWEAR